MDSDAAALPPHELTPAFYGCLDWHSDVHGHWLLVRLLRLFPQAPFAAAARAEVARSLTAANIAGELKYLQQADRASFERPYGLAWLLQLCSELRAMAGPAGAAVADARCGPLRLKRRCDWRTGCRSSTTRFESANTIRRHSRSG